MFNNDQISAAIFFFIGLLIILFSIPYGLGSFSSPETGFMPLCYGMAVSILSILVFIDATSAKKNGVAWENVFKGLMWKKPLMTLAALVFYVLFLERLGFIITTFLFVGFLLKCIHPQKWFVVVLGAVITPVICYLIFHIGLQTQLPEKLLKF